MALLLLMALASAAVMVPAGAAAKQTQAVGTGGAVASDTVQATRAGLNILAGRQRGRRRGRCRLHAWRHRPVRRRHRRRRVLRLLRRHTHRVYTIDGRETAPATATSSLFIDPQTGKPLSFPTAVTSGLSVGVPGTLMTWQRALRAGGSWGWPATSGPRSRWRRRASSSIRPCARRLGRTHSASRSSARPRRSSFHTAGCRWWARRCATPPWPDLPADRPARRRRLLRRRDRTRRR